MRPLLATALFTLSITALAAPCDTAAPATSRTPAQPPADRATAGAPNPGSRAPTHRFYFTRAAYSASAAVYALRRGTGGDYLEEWTADHPCDAGYCGWATDYPKADQQFLTVLRRLTNLDASPRENSVKLTDPNLHRFPFLYAVEVGYMSLTDAEVKGLRDYLLAGGLLMVDDFWGSEEWRSFQTQMRRVFPSYAFVEIPPDHEIFRSFYDIDEIIQVPNLGQGVEGGSTAEKGGDVPHLRGIFDEKGHLLVVANWNTDLGDAWEWAEEPRYPLRFSTYAYQIGVNIIVYAMSH